MEGAPRSRAAGPLDAGAEGRSPGQWYNKLGSVPAAEPTEPAPGADQRPHRRFDEVAPCPAATTDGQAGDDTATGLPQAIQHVTDQTAELAARLSALTEAHERHAEERARLEAKIDRLCGLLAAGGTPRGDGQPPRHG